MQVACISSSVIDAEVDDVVMLDGFSSNSLKAKRLADFVDYACSNQQAWIVSAATSSQQ
jgi:hypothetical protein